MRARLLPPLVGFLWWLTASSGTAYAEPSPPSGPTSTVAPSPPVTADEPGLLDFGARMRSGISEWFSDLLTSALGPVFDLLGRTIFSTPRIDVNERVKDIWGFSIGVADASLLVLVLAGAVYITAAGGLEQRLTAKELIPRLLLAASSANLSLLALGLMIETSNALSRGVFGSVDPESVGSRMAETVFTGTGLNVFVALIGLVVVVLALLLVVVYLLRVAVLVVLAAAAPLMLVTYGLPQCEMWAKMWWRATIALLVTPVVQSFLVAAAFRVFLSGDGLLGFSSGGLIDLLMIGSILYLSFKVPLWGLKAAFLGGVSSRLRGAASGGWERAKSWATTAAKASAV